MIFLLFVFSLWANQPEIPYKPNDEFAVEIKLELKPKPVEPGKFDFTETVDQRNRRAAGNLPFLYVNLKLIELHEEEVRVRGYNNLNSPLVNKKAEEGMVVKLNLGFTDDLKDRVAPHEFTVYTLDAKKKEVARIHMLVQEDGTFLVNGEVRGKF